MKKIIFAFLVSFSIGCKDNIKDIHQPDKIVSGPGDLFDSGMLNLIKKYPYPGIFNPPKNTRYQDLYELEKRVNLPKFHNLTFDFRIGRPIAELYFPFLNIYNDTFNFVLPLTDSYFQKLSSKNKTDTALRKNQNLSNELSILIQKLGISDNQNYQMLLDEIMAFFDAKRIMSETDLSSLKIYLDDFKKNGVAANSCLENLVASFNKTKERYLLPNTYVYSNGIMIYVFFIGNDQKVDVEILNTDCNYY